MHNERLPLTSNDFTIYSGTEPITTQNGHKLTVQESSAAWSHCARLIIEDNPVPSYRRFLTAGSRTPVSPDLLMDREQASQLRDALDRFLNDD